MESMCQKRLLELPTQEQVFWQKLQPVWNLWWSGLFLTNCTWWDRPMLEKFIMDCIP